MKNTLDWIKTNPFIVACGGVALLGLLGIGYLLLVAAPGFTETRSNEIKQYLDKQRSFMNVSVPLPNEDPNAPPDIETVVINDEVIRDVSRIYGQIKSQYDTIRLDISDKNASRHRSVLLGGGDIWPDADPRRYFARYERAAADYRDHFEAVFDPGNDNPWAMPSMRASSPPSSAEVSEVLEETAFNFLGSIGVSSAAELTDNQANQLYAEQRMQLMQLLADRARRINLYAQLPEDQDPFFVEPSDDDRANTGGGNNPLLGGGSRDRDRDRDNGLPAGYPFFIADWAYAESAPKPDELWEGQVQLWIMRDIMHAIAQVNQVDDNPQASVLNSPIKRLVRLGDVPGYVGMHTVGGVFDETDSDTDGGFDRERRTPRSRPSGEGSGASRSDQVPSIYPDPPSELEPKEPTDAAPEHFGITPSGRVSNSVFDVRHSRLVIDIEWDKLPLFVEQLRKTNFMTVIDADIRDLDEYALLREGYVYGKGDVVRANLLIESLWFREWTGELMPKVVRQKLLIEPLPNARDADEQYPSEDQPY